VRRQELAGAIQRRGRFVEDRGIGLEDVGHAGTDVKRDLDVCGRGYLGEADGVVLYRRILGSWVGSAYMGGQPCSMAARRSS
jgi:hypothetical protein